MSDSTHKDITTMLSGIVKEPINFCLSEVDASTHWCLSGVVDHPCAFDVQLRLHCLPFSLRLKTGLENMQETHISKLKEGMDAGGDASLQNGLDLAVSSLKSVPPYGHREVCVLAFII